jgi:hypothetical protein
MYITTGISFPVISPAWAVIIMPTANASEHSPAVPWDGYFLKNHG